MTQRKDAVMVKKMRKWRLIVRNAAFTCTENDFRKEFEAFGEIQEIVMPQKGNRFAGFCFIQFCKFPDAVKAMKEMNGKKVNGRIVAVDWAVPKDQYETAVYEEKQTKTKDIKVEEEAEKSSKIKIEEVEKSSDKKTKKNEEAQSASSESDSDQDSNSEQEEEKEIEVDHKLNETNARPDQAVEEGRTLFVRGIPFDVDEDEFRDVFEKFGELKYALICKYPNTDHSKGSGFVQFIKKEYADSCLDTAGPSSSHDNSTDLIAERSGLFIKKHRLTVCKAVAKSEAKKIDKEKHDKQPKDRRNLHLLRLGLIRGGTKEANGMSNLDSSKRLRIESANRQKIKNLHIFVSPTRLCVHNLPTNLTPNQLRTLCLENVDDRKAKITECRIMRDLNRLNADGVGKSRGYAFVEFVQHDHALKCLKTLNNNPSIFSDDKRPIVEFSLENRAALNIKQKRLEAFRANKESSEKGEVTRKRVSKTSFKPNVVVPTDGALKLQSTKKPFPSHMGPKIRHKKRQRVNETSDKVIDKKGKGNKKMKKQNKINNNSTKTGIAKKRRRVAPEDTTGEEYGKRSKKRKHWYEDRIGDN